jgi:hypothetical protein
VRYLVRLVVLSRVIFEFSTLHTSWSLVLKVLHLRDALLNMLLVLLNYFIVIFVHLLSFKFVQKYLVLYWIFVLLILNDIEIIVRYREPVLHRKLVFLVGPRAFRVRPVVISKPHRSSEHTLVHLSMVPLNSPVKYVIIVASKPNIKFFEDPPQVAVVRVLCETKISAILHVDQKLSRVSLS